MRLLLVEDEARLADALVYIFKKNNYGVDVACDGILGQEMAEAGIYDVIVLDRMLPGKEGLQVLRELRSQGITTPVIILTAKDAVSDRVEGLDCGADDYLVKPFSTEELMARIRALSRRQSDRLNDECIRVSSIVFKPLSGDVACGGRTIRLTAKESQIFELLLRNRNLVITKDKILERVWGPDSDADFSNIEVYLSYLRKKLAALDCDIQIETIRGVGYCIREGNHV